MLLIELPTLSISSRVNKLGLVIDSEEDLIEVSTFIDVSKITHIKQNPDNKKLTNIYLIGGEMLMTGIEARSLVTQLSGIVTEEEGDDSDLTELPDIFK